MPLRSFHFIPADRPSWVAKATQAGADALIFDLEDAVPGEQKKDAANLLSTTLAELCSGSQPFIRVNGVDSTITAEENNIIKKHPQLGVVLPKVSDLRTMRNLLKQYPCSEGRKIVILLESPAGVENCSEIMSSHPIFGVGLGLEDLLSVFIFNQSELDTFVAYTRSRVALASIAYGCLPIDTVSLDTEGKTEFQLDATNARRSGMRAKFTIHPEQIAATNRIFAPGKEAIQEARELIREVHQNPTIGYGRINGRIISPPKVAKAKLIIND